MFKHRNEVGSFALPNGDTVVNPVYVDYMDGVGEQLCGGHLYDKNGKYLGHCDPPGMKGHWGYSGYSGK